MKMFNAILLSTCVAAVSISCAGSRNQRQEATKSNEKIRSSITVLNSLLSIPDSTIPENILRNAYGIAVFPGVLKGAFLLGGRYGDGVMSIKQENDSWSHPAFMQIKGGSIGWQWGVESIDLVLVFKTLRSIETAASGQFVIGADVGAAAGPVGRNASASTDAQLKSEIFSYARARGLFAGASLDGTSMVVDNAANQAFYQTPNVTADQVFHDTAAINQVPSLASQFQQVMDSIATEQGMAAE